MKNIYIVLLYGAFMNISAYAQKISADKVPSLVAMALKIKFLNAADTDTHWEMEHEKDYEVNFKVNNARQSAVFDATGKWMESESEIKVSELSSAAKESIAKQFPGFKIEEAEKYEDTEHGSCYEVEIEKGKDTFDVLISVTGEVLSQKAEIKKNEKEEDKD
jgi:hypothetical protein